jgi:DNA-binding SARP family transcriptional activator
MPLASAVFELTAGWPAAVRLTAEALRTVPPEGRLRALGPLHRPGGQLFAYIAEEVLARAAPSVRQLLRRVALFERFDAGLCKAIGLNDPSASLVALRRTGLLLERRPDEGDGLGLHTLVREFVRERWPLDDNELRKVHRRAAVWFEEHGAYDDALDSLIAIGDLAGVARLLGEKGELMLAAGKVEATIQIVEQLPLELRTARVERLVGEAHEIRGEWDEALRCFERVAQGKRRLDAGLAWRVGMIHHLRGELGQALDAYERGDPDAAEPRDAALLLAWKSTAHWLRGDEEACRKAAEESFARATAAHDAGALAAAHNALAMLAAIAGDRLANDTHYLRALDYAERAGDVVQAVRVRTNRGSRHLEEGEYEEALAELEIAARSADLTGFAFFRALALTNRGEVRFRLGRLEEAIADLENAKLLYQRTASRMVSYPLALLGDVYRERGDIAAARAFYAEAIEQSEQAGDVQGLVPPLAALAQLLASEEPQLAGELAARAVAFGEGMAHVAAQLAAGWVALTADNRESAAAYAENAAGMARTRRDRAGLAQALELGALATEERRRRTADLNDAVSIWRGIGDPLGQARAELLLGAVTGGADGAALAEQAEKRLRDAGAHGYRVLLAPVLPSLAATQTKSLTITTLGRFGIIRGGRPVGHSEWQSRKARDLLKILVVRRGRRTPRALLMEALWPGEDPHRLSNRLSVALSTLRSVLDPERQRAPDHFVSASGDAIELRLVNVEIDVERLLEDGEEGLRLYREDALGARARLESAEAMYVGDFLDEDLYEDWATPMREEVRAMYLAVTTTLADIAESAADHDAATRYWLRVLERDPYDERAHLGVTRALIDAGRHGEARRTYRRYASRMAELGIESSPFPTA